jgi:hypothetical protein
VFACACVCVQEARWEGAQSTCTLVWVDVAMCTRMYVCPGAPLCVCIHSRVSVHRISTMASTDGRDARVAIVAIAAGEIHHDDACDVVSVVARNKVIALAAGSDRKRCFSQRSWELMQRARFEGEEASRAEARGLGAGVRGCMGGVGHRRFPARGHRGFGSSGGRSQRERLVVVDA